MKILITVVSIVLFSFTAKAQQWKLVWSDEFNYKGLPDSTKWTGEVGGHGWGNNELQFYTGIRKENARVQNGKLVIEARKEKWEDTPSLKLRGTSKNYTSARLVTKDKGDWQYGKIEVRAKIPKGRGTWPAIWMLGSTTPLNWPDDGEIDIMEHVGFHQGFIHATIHCKKYYHVIGTQKTDTLYLKDCAEKFHLYGVEWNKDSIKIAVDKKVYFSFANEHSGYDAWPFDNKMFLILNIAVGGNWGGEKGIDDKIFPQKMEIDYVRVWQKK